MHPHRHHLLCYGSANVVLAGQCEVAAQTEARLRVHILGLSYVLSELFKNKAQHQLRRVALQDV